MSMINCPECGAEISDSAKNCPECGYPISKSKSKKKIWIIRIAALAVIMLLVVSGTYYLENRLDRTERKQVDNVITAITDIGDVSLSSESKIIHAENLYSELSEVCKRHISNYEDLKDARENYNILRANSTIGLIAKIEEVTLDSQSVIKSAQTSYDALSDEQKELVSNYEDLASATEKLSELKIDHVQTLISDIGTVSLDSDSAIQIALRAYEDLSENEKKSVENYDDLVEAEAENCVELIDAIGTVTLEDESKIKKARNAYTSLSAKAKKLVTNYGVLSQAEETYTALEKEEEIEGSSETASDNSGDVTPSFKATMDSYEEFFDKYVAFIKKYKEADANDALAMLSDYTEMLTKYAEMTEAMDDIDTDSLSTADYAYYIEVTARISTKLLEVSN